MIKKSLSGILVLLIFINSIGCYSKAFVSKKDMEKLSEGDNITVISQDMKTYMITIEKVEGTEIHGFEYTGDQKSQVVIHAEEISTIEMKKLDAGKIILIGCICIAVIAYGGLIIPLEKF